MDTCRPTFKLLLIVWGLFVFLHRSSAQRNAEEIIDIDGNVIPMHNVSGCYADFVTLTCTGSGIAPVRHIFTFRPPDVQENFNCLQCAGAESNCSHNCCTGNSSVDCRSDQQPTKDLKQRLDDCSHNSQCIQVIGRTSLSNSQECPNFLQSHGIQVYSQNEDIEYLCISQNWEIDVTLENSKTGAALFLKSRDRFYGENKLGFNLSCIVTSDEDTTIVIKSLDLRMCKSPCEQHLYFIESAIMREVTLNETNSLGLGLLYQSTTNNLTLRLDSNPTGNLTLWLYVKPSNGSVTVQCQSPLFITTTTTVTTSIPTTPLPDVSSELDEGSLTTQSNSTGVDAAGLGDSAVDILTKMLLYDRIAVTGLLVLVIITLSISLWLCCMWRMHEKRARTNNPDRPENYAYKNQQPQGGGNHHYGPFPYRSNQLNHIYEGDVESDAFSDYRSDRGRAERSRPKTSHQREPQKKPRSYKSESEMKSSKTAREKLMDLVAGIVKDNPEKEKQLRVIAKAPDSTDDIWILMSKMETRELREVFEAVQKNNKV